MNFEWPKEDLRDPWLLLPAQSGGGKWRTTTQQTHVDGSLLSWMLIYLKFQQIAAGQWNVVVCRPTAK